MNTDRDITQRIIREVSERHGVSYEDVEDVHKSIWEYTRRAVSLPTTPDILLVNFGVIRISVNRLRRIILGAIRKYKKGTWRREVVVKIVQRTWPVYKEKWRQVQELKSKGRKYGLK